MATSKSYYAVEIQNLSIQYPGKSKFALENINLRVKKGELICIMGSAGAGKTTLSLCLNGLIPHSMKTKMLGRVMVNGVDTRNSTVVGLSETVGIVFQDPDAQIFCSSVEEEVSFALSNRNVPTEIIKKEVEIALSKVGLKGYEERFPQNLSGGEKQRVAIASVLSVKPQIMVLDEPTSQLDPIGTSEVFRLINELSKKERITTILTEHKSEEIASVADRVVVLESGRIRLEGPPSEVFKYPNLLEEYGIRPPQVSEIALKLMSKNFAFQEFPVTYEQGLKSFREGLNNPRRR